MILRNKFLIVFYIIFFLSISLKADEKVTLQLKWFHQFQFAGYYAAKEKGFYKDVGLDVEIKQRDLEYNNIEQVIIGEAEYGVADSILMLYKAKNLPAVVVAPIFQHSPSILMTLKNSELDSPYKFNDKKMLFYTNDTDGFSILAMMKKLNQTPQLTRLREKNDFLKLISKEVDIFPGYISNEPYYFKQRGIEINIFDPANYGFDLYGDMLFTNIAESLNHPERVQKFKEASIKGWQYALDNKEEIIQLIYNKYTKEKSLEHLRYEAEAIEKLISKQLIPIGTIDNGRMHYIFEMYKDYGLIDKKFDDKGFIFDEYIKTNNKLNLSELEQKYLDSIESLRVQTFASFPPFNFRKNGETIGYTIDYVNLIGKILDKKIDFVADITWKESLEMIQNGELDILPNIAWNKERDRFVGFTDVNHLVYQVAFGFKKGSNINSMNDLKDKTISVLDKSFLHTILKNRYPKQNLYLAPTIEDAVNAVAVGKSDAVIDNLATIEYYIKENWLSNMVSKKVNNIRFIPNAKMLHMGVAKQNKLLRSILEKADRAIAYNEVLTLKDKWLDNKREVKFSNEQYRYLKNKKVLKMCIDPNWLPLEKIEKGKHIGMTSEYIDIFRKNLPIPIELVETKNWLETISFGKTRKCDFITVMMLNEDRKKYFNFTHNLMDMPLVIATKQDKPFINDLEDVKQYSFGIVKGFAYTQVLRQKFPNLNVTEVSDALDGLQKVNKGDIYGFIGTLPVIAYNIQKNFGTNLKIDGKLEDVIGFPMAVRNDEKHLVDIFNKLIESISREKKNEILSRWITIKYQEKIDYKTALFIALVALIIIMIIILKNRAISDINKKLSGYINVVDKNVLTSETDVYGTITFASQAFCDISGYSKNELIGKNHNIIRHPDTPKEVFEDLWQTIKSGQTWKGEIKNKRKDGTYYWVAANISPKKDDDGKIIGYTSIRHNITDKKIVERLSITDDLTNLYNKRYFNEVFAFELNKARRLNQAFGLMILDVDNFKKYNDFYGHQKGDEVLRAVGMRLKELCKRATDIPFRIGGEEFAIIFIPKAKLEAKDFAKLINEKIESLEIEHKLNDASSFITVSSGVYYSVGTSFDTDKDIYDYADKALYKAKAAGRNQFVIYES